MDVGPGWTNGAGVWPLQSNRATETTAGANTYSVYSDSGHADITVTTYLVGVPAGTTACGLAVRVVDQDNFWFVCLEDNGGGDNLNIYRRQGAANILALSAAVAIAGDHTLTVNCNGNTLAAYLDGVLIGSYASASFQNTATRCGLAPFAGVGYLPPTGWGYFEVPA